MKAVLYARVSSQMQSDAGTIASQIDYAQQYCRLQKIAILATYLDEGVSGTVRVCERPAGARLLADAKAGKFDTVLVFRIDRLARRTSDLLNTTETLEEAGVSIRSLTEPFDTSTAAGKFMVSTLGGIAELERAGIIERSRSGMERLAREGRWLGGRPPFGYEVVDGKLAIHSVQGQIVKDIFTWYLCGERVRAIARKLNILGTRHPMEWSRPGAKRPWYESTVSKLLKNRVYIGEFTWRKRTDRKKVAGRWTYKKTSTDQQIRVEVPALVSLEDFNQVQQILKDNQTFSKRNAKHFYLLRGLIICGECGRRYIGMGSGRPRWYKHYYRCSSHVSGVGRVPCAGKAIRADHIEPLIWDQCVAFITNPASILDDLVETMRGAQNNQRDIKSEIAQMESVLLVKARERAKVITLIRRGLITDAEGERELALLQAEQTQIEQQKTGLSLRLAAAENSELNILAAECMVGALAEKVAEVNESVRREIVSLLVDKITVTTVNERPKATVSYIFRPASSASSQAVDCVERTLAISNARLAETCPRTSLKSMLKCSVCERISAV